MDKKPLISIIIPVYKVEEYLNDCVQSVIHQTYKNLEIILVDDGSPDKCPDMCDDYSKIDSRILALHKKNGGLSSARNYGLDHCKGDYIAFVDSDDYLQSNAIANLVNGFKLNKKIAIVSGNVLKVQNDIISPYIKKWQSKKNRIIVAQDFAKQLLSTNRNFTVWSKLYRADIMKNIRFREGVLNEDSLFIFDLSSIIEKTNSEMLEIPNPVYYYRKRDNSITTNSKKPLEISVIDNYINMSKECAEKRPALSKILLNCSNYYLLVLNRKIILGLVSKSYYEEYHTRLAKVNNATFICSNKLKDIISFMLIKYFPKAYSFMHV